MAELGLGLSLSPRFLAGASIVAISGWVYHEHDRVHKWIAGHVHDDMCPLIGRGAQTRCSTAHSTEHEPLYVCDTCS